MEYANGYAYEYAYEYANGIQVCQCAMADRPGSLPASRRAVLQRPARQACSHPPGQPPPGQPLRCPTPTAYLLVHATSRSKQNLTNFAPSHMDTQVREENQQKA